MKFLVLAIAFTGSIVCEPIRTEFKFLNTGEEKKPIDREGKTLNRLWGTDNETKKISATEVDGWYPNGSVSDVTEGKQFYSMKNDPRPTTVEDKFWSMDYDTPRKTESWNPHVMHQPKQHKKVDSLLKVMSAFDAKIARAKCKKTSKSFNRYAFKLEELELTIQASESLANAIKHAQESMSFVKTFCRSMGTTI